MSNLDAILAQYEKNSSAASSNNTMSQEDRLKKYFTTALPKGQTTAEKRIRILPVSEGSPFVEVYFHELQVDGNWVKLYDPKQEGKRSPLNEVAEALKLTGVDSDKELAKNYYPRKFYVVKVIDRDNEADGVKFWRFKHSKKKDGIFDKIYPIFKSKGDITNPETGRDLTLFLSLQKAPNGKEYTTVTSVMQDDVSPLSTDKEQAEKWLNDTTTWSDVYAKKPEEYLEIIARGGTPKWSTGAKKWVSSDEVGEINMSVANVVDEQADDLADEGLPF